MIRRTFQYQGRAEPLAEPLSVDRWLATWPQPLRRVLSRALLASGLFAPILEPVSVAQWQPSCQQPGRGIVSRALLSQATIAPVMTPAPTVDLFTSEWPQPSRGIPRTGSAIECVPFTEDAVAETERDIREAIVERLLASPHLAAIVGATVRPLRRPQSESLSTAPCITVTVTDDPRGHWLSGGNGQSIARVQFDCWALRVSDCVRLKRALEHTFDGGRWTAAGVTVQWSRQLSVHDLGDDPHSGADAPIYRIVADYAFKYLVPIHIVS